MLNKIFFMKGTNNMNATIIVALLAAISAITAPILTSFINNHYQLKMKQLELYFAMGIVSW